MSLLIRDCTVLTGEESGGYRSGQNIVIRNGEIVAVGPSAGEGETFDVVVDGRRFLAIPGLVSAHTHSPENLLKGTIDRLPLEPWLVHLFGGCPVLTPREVYLSCLLGAVEMLKTGTTAVIDHLWMAPQHSADSLNAALQAYADAGIRAAVAPLFGDVDYEVSTAVELGYQLGETFFARRIDMLPPLSEQFALFEDAIRRWHGARNGRLQVFLGPSGIQWCSEALLVQAHELASKYQTGFHIHNVETAMQAWILRRRFGKSGVAWLRDAGILGPHVSLAHSVWLDPGDIEHIVACGAVVVHNPAANLRLGSGFAPVVELLRAGAKVALGNDGAASSDNQVTFQAIKLASLIHNSAHADPDDWVSARQAFEMATVGGAYALGMGGRLGSIEPGYRADIALLRLDSPLLTPLTDAYRLLAYSETGHSVDTVIVDGQVVVAGGKVLTVCEQTLIEEVREAVREWRARGGTPPPDEIELATREFLRFRGDLVSGKLV
jgi:cytosine/adenosine deaminase-related metal-dependent hydrolase